MNIPPALMKKVGPLPLWGWGVAVGGAGFLYKTLHGGSSSGLTEAPTEYGQTGVPAGFLEGITQQLFDIQAKLDDEADIPAGTTPPINVGPPVPKPVIGPILPIVTPGVGTDGPINSLPSNPITRIIGQITAPIVKLAAPIAKPTPPANVGTFAKIREGGGTIVAKVTAPIAKVTPPTVTAPSTSAKLREGDTVVAKTVGTIAKTVTKPAPISAKPTPPHLIQ